MRGQAQAHSSIARGTEGARDDWRTPDVVLDRVRMIGRILCDPCSNVDNSTGADIVYSGPDGNGIDGLTESWGDPSLDGLAFANYPYSESIAWATKMVAEAKAGVKIIGLGPARPDTKWHRIMMSGVTAVGFWRSRITFVGAPGPAPFPSALFFFNLPVIQVVLAFGDVADIYLPPLSS